LWEYRGGGDAKLADLEEKVEALNESRQVGNTGGGNAG
jgi:hypothetical protein